MENSAEVPAGQRAGRDKKGKPQKGTDKQRGELAEMRFMLKAAEIYRDVLHDDAQARATLEKVITRFPGSRFAYVARERMAELSHGS